MVNTQSAPLVQQLLYKALLLTATCADKPRTSRMWHRLWRKLCCNATGSVKVKIHGQSALVNLGNTYPMYSRRFPTLNSPLTELVSASYASNGRKVIVVDVGAAIGDTILLLRAKCGDMLGDFYCIDGDVEFYSYLQQNVGDLPGAHLSLAMLSSSDTTERSLARTHGGTASAQGTGVVKAITLDSFIAISRPQSIDVLKIDVDGLDGKVLAGAVYTLAKFRPNVIFEWHPILCMRTGNSWYEHHDVLRELSYEAFLWFDKYGNFSHFMNSYDRDTIDLMANYCLSEPEQDRHFDIIALPCESNLSPVRLANLKFAGRC